MPTRIRLPEKFVFVLLRQASTQAILKKRQDAFGTEAQK
jgi:hypothetical protein